MSHILLLKEGGHVLGYGSFEELVASGIAVADEIKGKEADVSADAAEPADASDGEEQKEIVMIPTKTAAPFSLDGRNLGDGKIIVAEGQSRGKISASVYKRYFLASGGLMAVLSMFFFLTGTQTLQIVSDYTLARWVQMTPVDANRTSELALYGSLVGALVVFAIVRGFVFFHRVMKASVNLHDRMFVSVTGTSVSFFDTNPVGMADVVRYCSVADRSIDGRADSEPVQQGCVVSGRLPAWHVF